jgi:hypothetical protein
VDMFPISIATPNKYGMLPFHCACLNPNSAIEILMLFISMSPEVMVPIQPSSHFLTKENTVAVKQTSLK